MNLFFDNNCLFLIFDKYIYKLMTKQKKSPKQQPTEIPMANKDIMVITGIKMKCLSLKENEYGHNHFFNVLGITPLQQLIELRKSLKCRFGIIMISSIYKSMI